MPTLQIAVMKFVGQLLRQTKRRSSHTAIIRHIFDTFIRPAWAQTFKQTGIDRQALIYLPDRIMDKRTPAVQIEIEADAADVEPRGRWRGGRALATCF